MSPISYVGKKRASENARELYALAIDLDGVIIKDGEPIGLYTLFHQIEKIDRGLFQLKKFQNQTTKQATNSNIKEEDFYQPFADWLVNDIEECTNAIPLGRNLFQDKWGTPDVIGIRESKRSDIIQLPTEVISAEIKIKLGIEGTMACLDVIDQGAGVSAEYRQQVFEPFFQGKQVIKGPVKGTGLGLAIVQRYVLLHNGNIQVMESDQGAHFRICLPLDKNKKKNE